MRNVLILFAALWLSPLSMAQETRGMIFGRVLDPQSTVIVGAAVAVTNADTNTIVRLQSNQTGYYEASLLLPGNYQVTVECAGFKMAVRRGIVLPVGGRLEIDMRMELGAVTERLEVTAEAPILDSNSVSTGRVLDNRTLMDLPVLNNSPALLAKLAPGIFTSGVNSRGSLHSVLGVSDLATLGGVGGNEWSIDGVPNSGSARRLAYVPYSDTIQEFRVETSGFDASVGHTTGAGISMMTKSGTNEYHGALTEQHWQQRWNGVSFFIKQQYYRDIAAAEAGGDKARADYLRSQDKQPSGRSNNYSASIGGPVQIPGLYNGRNKLFFFFSLTGVKDARTERASLINYTIPTMANRQGDFSQLLSVDPVRYQIYDPLSVRPDPARPTHYIRDPIPGNVIPRSRMINPAYGAYEKLLPTPNSDPLDPTKEPTYNYKAVGIPNAFDYIALHNRLDYNHSDKHRFFGRWSWNDWLANTADWTYESTPGLHNTGQYRNNRGAMVDWVYTAKASTLLDVVVAFNEYVDGNKRDVSLQFKPSDVGLPTYLDQRAGELHQLPYMTFSGYQGMGYSAYPTLNHYRVFTSKADVSHVRGAHTLRAGIETRQTFRTGGGGGNTSGSFAFGNNFTRRNDDSFTPAGSLGHGWAAFMMGIPGSMNIGFTDSWALHNPYYATYLQHNWRATSKLSLNGGLRIEYEGGPTERYNRTLAGFDADALLPISEGAKQAYAKSPAPEMNAANFDVRGGTRFAGQGPGGRHIVRGELLWMPRLAATYQVAPRTVLRAGYGMFYDTFNVFNQGVDQYGYSRTTSTNLTNDYGMTWLVGNPGGGVSPLADPFPVRADGTRYDAPTGSALNLMTRAGRGYSYIPYDFERPRQQRWRVGMQRQLSPNMVIEAAYVGSYADRVSVGRKLDVLAESYWADGLVRDNAIATNLNANVTNPFRLSNFAGLQQSAPLVYQDMSTNGFFTSSTIRKNVLLRPFPQMNGLDVSLTPEGKVRTDALEVTFERRFARGFNLSATYTRLRNDEATVYVNEFDTQPTWEPSNAGRPHRFTATSIIELPFGQGRAMLQSGPLSRVFGGWQFAVTYEFQPGPMLGWGNLFYYGDTGDIGSGERTLDRWFNTDGFERAAAKGPASFHRRVFPRRFSDFRADMTNQWNANIQREFKIGERVALQLRLDALNLQNRSQFAGPNTDPFSTNFGRVTAQTEATNRFIQIQGRLRF